MEPLLTHHLQLLSQWRDAMNLVGPGPLQAHYLDAKEALRPIEQPQGRWADLGTGAGFPGIVFAALYPTIPIDLVDSRAKRCAFLDRVVATAPVSTTHISVRCLRLETLDDHQYDGLLSRALAAPLAMMEHARRLLRPNGLLLLLLQEDGQIPEALDFHILRSSEYEVDGKKRRSVLLSWRPDSVGE